MDGTTTTTAAKLRRKMAAAGLTTAAGDSTAADTTTADDATTAAGGTTTTGTSTTAGTTTTATITRKLKKRIASTFCSVEQGMPDRLMGLGWDGLIILSRFFAAYMTAHNKTGNVLELPLSLLNMYMYFPGNPKNRESSLGTETIMKTGEETGNFILKSKKRVISLIFEYEHLFSIYLGTNLPLFDSSETAL
jgi:hypothetical protein